MKKFDNPEKRVYSLNLLAYIEMRTGRTAELHNEGDLFYGIFPEEKDVAAAVNEYRQSNCQVNLHDYLNAFKDMRNRINQVRNGGNK